ncbi:GTPase activating protein [Coemansia sp. Benny D115]|nr:GTPase activating protein [Coemansia sp. Benny D115]
MGGGPAELSNSPSEFSDYCIVSEVARVRLLYSKSKVYVYRSTDRRDRISGFICVVQGPDDQYYIAWMPEALLSEGDREAYVQVELCPSFFDESTGGAKSPAAGTQVSVNMRSEDGSILVSTDPMQRAGSITSISSYAFCKPVGEIRSLLIHPPSLTQWYGSVIVNLVDGTSLAPMWFHDEESASSMLGMTRHWGGDELLIWLAQAVSIGRSLNNPNLYEFQRSKTPHVVLSLPPTPSESTVLATPDADPRVAQKSTSAAPSSSQSAYPPPQHQHPQRAATTSPDIFGSALQGNVDPLVRQAKELRWGILERFSRITRTMKDAATSFIETPVGRQVAPYMPPSLASLSRSASASGSLVKEYESARIYLAKWAAQHIIDQQHEDGERESRMAAEAGASGSNNKSQGSKREENAGHQSIWEEWLSESGDLGSFELINTDKSAKLPQPFRTRPALTAEKWFEFFEPRNPGESNPDFRMTVDPDTVRQAIFAGGVEEDMRPLVWKYLLNIYPWDSSDSERRAIDKHNSDEYWLLKEKWLTDPEFKDTSDYIEQSDRIEKDVLRTDRTLPLFATDSTHGGSDEVNLSEHGLPGSNASLERMKDILMTFHYYDKRDLGYVQGMSDLLAPIFSVYQDEPSTFWAFTEFMKRMRPHFLRDQSGMQDELSTLAQLIEIANPKLFKHLEKCDASNMFCCFRWLLIWFKREFSFENILRLWEVLWTDYLTDRFILFVALAILQRHSDIIIDHLQSPEEVLKYVQDLSDTIDLNDALKGAEVCFYKVRYRVQIVERIRAERGLKVFVDSDDNKDSEAVGSTEKNDEKDEHSEKMAKGSPQTDSEVPLINFEWDESQDANNNSSSNEAEPALTTAKEPATNAPQEPSTMASPTNTTNLPEISESVHKIFERGYQL